MGPFDNIRIAFEKAAMRDASVRSFVAVLSGLLTKYDRQESAREMKRGIPTNIYRLGHLLGAAEKVEADMKPFMKRDDTEAMAALRVSLGKHFAEGFRPIRAMLRAIDAWEQKGQFPKYGASEVTAQGAPFDGTELAFEEST